MINDKKKSKLYTDCPAFENCDPTNPECRDEVLSFQPHCPKYRSKQRDIIGSNRDKTGDEIAFRSIDFRYCPDKCQLCGIKAELRPYGPDGKWVCYDCGMLDEDNAKQIFSTILNG
jgi:hypothetical protein